MHNQIATPVRLVTRAEKLAEAIHHAELIHKVLCIRTRRPSPYPGPTFRRDQHLSSRPMPSLPLRDQVATVMHCEQYRGPAK